ncbi:MAG: bifunctional diguanylate cyclase/phosphodiesterase [bacterium]|nr:bifunctional diguanylate cyclase/phosphodiesterase [bacterium]
MKQKIRTLTILSIGTVSCMILFLIMTRATATTNNFNGVLQACQVALCLLMVCADYKKGVILSYAVLALSLISSLRVMILFHNMMPLPGVCNLFIYFIVLSLLSRQLNRKEQQSKTDFLTGLLNRRGLYDLQNKKLSARAPFYLVYFNLKNFPEINDTHGHFYGDAVLNTVAGRMRKIVGKKGSLSRISGHEFVMLLSAKHDPVEITDSIITSISEKISIQNDDSNIDCFLSVYAGIAKYPDDATDFEYLLKYANIAMFHASQSSAQRIRFFNKDMERLLSRQFEIEQFLLDGFSRNSFYLDYQPQYKLDGKVLRGYEALLRLRATDGSVILPEEFLPVAEKSDLIHKIDNYVLRNAMVEFKDILTKSDEFLKLAVNISIRSFTSPDFVSSLSKLLDEVSFPAHFLELEITEDSFLHSFDDSLRNMKALRAMGISIALDDFGSGYTSLAYLTKLPINLLKIDKSLIDGLENQIISRDFVHIIISLGHLIGCEVLSEGVESEHQIALLRDLDCDCIQGYVWSMPLAYSNAKQLAAESNE